MEPETGATVPIILTMAFLTTVFLSLRYYSKLGIMRLAWSMDDSLLLAAYVFNSSICGLGICELFRPLPARLTAPH